MLLVLIQPQSVGNGNLGAGTLDMSTLTYCSLDVLLQGCTYWDQLNITLLCQQFLACFVNIGSGACSVVKQNDGLPDDVQYIVINMSRCTRKVSGYLGQLG